MLGLLEDIALVLPWWVWLLVSLASAAALALGGATALASVSAYGANYRVLSTRQRTMGRALALFSLLALPVFALLGVWGLGAAAWLLLA